MLTEKDRSEFRHKKASDYDQEISHSHTAQTNQRHLEEEPQNNNT